MKTLLFDKDEPWVKRGDSPMFDVTMGYYDGAEVCEMVGLFILNKISSTYPNDSIGLYRDDGENMNRRNGVKARNVFCKIL